MNRIKENQLGLFADRTGGYLWWPNQFRLLLASLAFVLMERLRNGGLAGTERARSQVWILRAKFLKVGAVIVRNTRRVRFCMASAFPYQSAYSCGNPLLPHHHNPSTMTNHRRHACNFLCVKA